jgi:hypothetical protein
VVFMSPPAFDILPATQPVGLGRFTPCRQADGTAAAEPPSGPGRGNGKGGGRGKGGDQPDAATQLARSKLPGLVNDRS